MIAQPLNLKNKQVSKRDYSTLKSLSVKTGVKDFWLIGSATYKKVASKIGVKFQVKDFDLVIEERKETYRSVIKKLKKRKFNILKSRTYYLKFQKTHQIIASKGSFSLDIAFVKDISVIGHFNWESIFWHYPTGQLRDPYEVTKYIKHLKLVPVVSPRDENPFILVARLAKLCARFNLSPNQDKGLRDFTRELTNRISTWKSSGYFHGRYAKEHSYAGVLQAILRAQA